MGLIPYFGTLYHYILSCCVYGWVKKVNGLQDRTVDWLVRSGETASVQGRWAIRRENELPSATHGGGTTPSRV